MSIEQAVVDVVLPRRFLFYIVADVGKGGSYRPLSVALVDASCHYSDSYDHSEDFHVFHIILHLMRILSDPVNRLAIQGELQLARMLYGDGRHDPPPTTLPDLKAGTQAQGLSGGFFDTDEEPTEVIERPPWSAEMSPFPFLSTCLFHAPAPWVLQPLSQSVFLQPLGTKFHDDNPEPIGMVVLDISDISQHGQVRYGIVSFLVRLIADVVAGDSEAGWDPVEDDPPLNDPMPTLDAYRPRVPQCASQCALNRGEEVYQSAIKELDNKPLVDPACFEFIWPELDHELDENYDDNSNDEDPEHPIESLRDQSIINLVKGTQTIDRFDPAALENVLHLADFRKDLLRILQKEPGHLGHSRAAGQILAFVYSGCDHLDWVMYKYLSADGIAAALESPELAQAKSLTLCIDLTTSSIVNLVQALSRSDSLLDIVLLAEPTRVEDQGVGDMIAAISGSADARVRRLLGPDVRFLLAGAYSKALRKQPWLRPSKPDRYVPNVDAFPVQQLLLRNESRVFEPQSDEPVNWKKNHFFLGDALLAPKRFAAGLMYFLAWADREEWIACFASSPPSLSKWSHCVIGPIPAEYFASIGGDTRQSQQQQRKGDEPPNKLQEIAANSWTVLVSQRWHVDYDSERFYREDRIYNQAKYMRYALVRARKLLSAETTNKDDKTVSSSSSESSRRPLDLDDIEVYDLKGFLLATAQEPGAADADAALVDQRLDEIAQGIAYENWNLGWQDPSTDAEVKLISVMEPEEALSMLQEFLDDLAKNV